MHLANWAVCVLVHYYCSVMAVFRLSTIQYSLKKKIKLKL
jgi:hypothetical protein